MVFLGLRLQAPSVWREGSEERRHTYSYKLSWQFGVGLGEWGEGKRGVWAKARGGSQGSPQSGQPDVAPSFPPDGWVCCSGTSCQARPLPRQNSGASVSATPRPEKGALQESDGESRRPGAGAVRGGPRAAGPQEACLPPRYGGHRRPAEVGWQATVGEAAGIGWEWGYNLGLL